MNFAETTALLARAGLLVETPPLPGETCFAHISYHSNDVVPGTLFIVKGERFRDEYLTDAAKAGAVCYVAEKKHDAKLPCLVVNDVGKAQALLAALFYKNAGGLERIAVTGSKGKTTCVAFISNILSRAWSSPVAYSSTVGYFDGVSAGKPRNNNTTMEPVDAWRVMDTAASNGARFMVMEVSSQAAKVDRIYGMEFDAGVFTNIAPDHLSENEHKDFEEYLEAKISILRQCRKVFIYRQTAFYDRIVSSLEGKEIITFGSRDADYSYSDPVSSGGEHSFCVTWAGRGAKPLSRRYSIRIFGEFNILNALASIAVATDLGADAPAIQQGLYDTRIDGRCIVLEDKTCKVVVDYAHNALSARALFESIRKSYPGLALKVVFGCPGGKGINRRAELGEVCGQFASKVYLTTDDPGYEEFEDINGEILAALPKETPTCVIEDREQAILAALSEAQPTDVVALIGKGHETTQFIGGVYYPYKSDLRIAEDYLAAPRA